ncbi:hypothetical protein GALMADRAFT_144741 [Galerina marginata CBS 339.88]|uniref:Uncharacterized protein n=1 Tax=Galerina marginata (strain CBS 339.88) TaxID=685588 RepID=A0A067SS22_GALM3|nr:hypothetical protein GALMADRAFT_144741 [Galerina marginata CBS 339.88]
MIPKRVGLVRPRDSANRVAFRKWHQPHQQPSTLLILTFNHHHLPLSPDRSLNTPRNVGFRSANEREHARCQVASLTLPNLRVVGRHSGSGIAQQGDREEGETHQAHPFQPRRLHVPASCRCPRRSRSEPTSMLIPAPTKNDRGSMLFACATTTSGPSNTQAGIAGIWGCGAQQ